MSPERWDAVMKQARYEAGVNLERRKIVGVQLSERSARILGTRWDYVAICGTECAICHHRVASAR